MQAASESLISALYFCPKVPLQISLRIAAQIIILFSITSNNIVAFAETPQTLIEQAKVVAESNFDEGVALSRRSIDLSQASSSTESEIEARVFLMDLLRARGNKKNKDHVALYLEQMARLNEISPADSPLRTVISLLQAELSLNLNKPDEAINPARKALKLAQHLNNLELIRSAQILLGVSLVRDLSVKMLLFSDKNASEEALKLLSEGVQGPVPIPLQDWIREGNFSLSDIYTSRNDLITALRLLEENAMPSTAPPLLRGFYLLRVANTKIYGNQRDQGARLILEGMAIVDDESDPFGKGVFYIFAALGLLDAGSSAEAEKACIKSIDSLGLSADGRDYLLRELQSHIIPKLDNLQLYSLGISVIERTLTVPEVERAAEVSLPLYAALGRYYAELYKGQEFTTIFFKAIRANEKNPDWRAMQDLYSAFAKLELYHRPNEAARYYRNAVYPGGDVFALLHRGLSRAIKLAMEIGYYQDAIDFGLIGLAFLNAKALDNDDVMEFLVDAGRAFTEIGRFDLAYDSFSIALDRLPKAHPDWEPRIKLEVSRFYARAGNLEAASLLMRNVKPFGMFERVSRTTPEYLFQIGQIYQSLGDLLRAEETFRMCIEQSSGHYFQLSLFEAQCRLKLARLLNERGDFKEGNEETTKSSKALSNNSAAMMFVVLELQREIVFDFIRVGILDVAETLVDQRSPLIKFLPPTSRGLAYRAAFQALDILIKRKRGKVIDISELKGTLGQLFNEPYLSAQEVDPIFMVGGILEEIGEYDLAIWVTTEHASRVEYIRSLLIDPTLKIPFGGAINVLFERITNLHLKKGTIEDERNALITYEANRARSVRDLLLSGQVKSEKKATGENVYDVARAAMENLLKTKGRPWTLEENQSVFNFLSLKLGLQEERNRGQPEDMQYKSTIISQSSTLPVFDVAELQARLDPSTVVLVYYFTADISGVWVISRDTLKWRTLGSWYPIRQATLSFRSEILSLEEGWDDRVKRSAQEAYHKLILPLNADIVDKTTIVIIPDKSTFGVPFEALIITDGSDAGKYLIEKFQIAYQLSLNLLNQALIPGTHKQKRPRKLLAMGDPVLDEKDVIAATRGLPANLPGAKQELISVRNLFGPEHTLVYTGSEDRKEVLRRNIGEFTALHFATHGFANEQHPWDSFLLFSGKGADALLTLAEIPALRISADLVVLSACETGQGRVLGGEGVWGFPSQFLSSGAQNVVVSLWQVDDESTAMLIEEFYRGMQPDFIRYGQALRAAKLNLFESKKWSHPYYWAPFVIYGGIN